VPCKITKKIKRREITEEELLLLKGDEYWSQLRTAGKMLNFLLVFGGSPKIFAENALETRWTREQIEEYIRENDLEDLREKLSESYRREKPHKIAYITVASDMRTKFFQGYPGLMARIKRNVQFAKEHGYIRGVFGATRNLIQEMLRGEYDNRENNLMMRNLDNICANTDIQNFEACIIHPAIVDVQNTFIERGMKSRVFNMVHDSTDFFIYKPELQEAADIIKERFERPVPELRGIPLPIDFDVSDTTKGDYYKGGKNLQQYINTYDNSNS
jgi:DNA polymerase I-like protein with 3'-5' exonuclease and polymerase domains